MSARTGGTTWALSFGRSEDLQIEFFIEHGEVTLRRGHQQFCGHADADAIVAGGVIDERMAQLWGHEAGVAGGGEQMLEAGQEFLAGGDAGGEAGADAGAQRDEFLAPQLIEQARIAREVR